MTWYEEEIYQLENKVRALSTVSEGAVLNGAVHEVVPGRMVTDRHHPVGDHPAERRSDRIVFYGSSSIRLWTTLAADFPGVDVLNLGFGGSTLAACTWFFERMLVPAAPGSVVFYAGDNDLGDGRHPEEVYLFFCAFAQKMRQHLPGVPLSFLSIKISPARWTIAPNIRRTNELIAQEISHYSQFQVVDTTSPLLDAAGRPRRELFENDGLHLSPAGYRVWQRVLQEHPGIL